MTLDTTSKLIGIAIGVLTLAGMVYGYYKVARPRWRKARDRVGGALDALVGREPILDPITGRELAPALPGIGVRMETVERAVAHIAELLDSQRIQDQEIAALRADLVLMSDRVRQLEAGAIERVATKAESISAFRAIEAVAKTPDTPPSSRPRTPPIAPPG